MTDAELCEKKGWTAGIVLEAVKQKKLKSDVGLYTGRRYRITAIGDERVLARMVAQRYRGEWHKEEGREELLSLSYSTWAARREAGNVYPWDT